MREELAIEKDLFGLLGGRETYVVDQSGTVVSVHNNQFDPKSHVTTALAAAESLPAGAPNPFEAFAEALSSLKPPELPAHKRLRALRRAPEGAGESRLPSGRGCAF